MSEVVLQTATGAIEVLGGSLSMGIAGRWTGHLETGGEKGALVGAVTLQLAREGGAPVLFRGSVVPGRSSDWQGRQRTAIVAGTGGLGAVLPFREYVGDRGPVQAAQLVSDILEAAGEAVAPGVLDTLSGLGVPRWTRPAAEGTRCLARVAKALGLGWRALDDGTIWVGVETWPAIADTAATFEEEEDGDEQVIRVAPKAATLRPGTTVLKRRILRVSYEISGDGSPRATLHYFNDVAEFAKAVRRVDVTDPLAQVYGAEVKAQHAEDGTLDLAVDSTEIPELRHVAFRVGVPGATLASMPIGARVRVAFEGASETGAYAFAPDQDPTADRAFALVGDSCGYLTAIAPPGTLGGPCTLAISGSSSPGSVAIVVLGPGHKYLKGVRG